MSSKNNSNNTDDQMKGESRVRAFILLYGIAGAAEVIAADLRNGRTIPAVPGITTGATPKAITAVLSETMKRNEICITDKFRQLGCTIHESQIEQRLIAATLNDMYTKTGGWHKFLKDSDVKASTGNRHAATGRMQQRFLKYQHAQGKWESPNISRLGTAFSNIKVSLLDVIEEAPPESQFTLLEDPKLYLPNSEHSDGKQVSECSVTQMRAAVALLNQGNISLKELLTQPRTPKAKKGKGDNADGKKPERGQTHPMCAEFDKIISPLKNEFFLKKDIIDQLQTASKEKKLPRELLSKISEIYSHFSQVRRFDDQILELACSILKTKGMSAWATTTSSTS